MGLLDFILSLVGLLLWFNWRAVRLSAATQPSVLSLASTLKEARTRPGTRWLYLVALVVLLGLRGLVYWQIGPALEWTPTVSFGLVALHFRSDFLSRMLLYSGLSFAVLLALCYFALLLLAIVNRRTPHSDPLHHLVRGQLGPIARWPVPAQFLLPVLVTALFWAVSNRGLARLGLAPAPPRGVLWQQAVILGFNTLLAWKYCIAGLVLLHVLNSYVYLGSSPFWSFVEQTGRNLLRTLRWLPLGIGKADLAPVAALGLVWLIAWAGSRGLAWLYQHPPL